MQEITDNLSVTKDKFSCEIHLITKQLLDVFILLKGDESHIKLVHKDFELSMLFTYDAPYRNLGAGIKLLMNSLKVKKQGKSHYLKLLSGDGVTHVDGVTYIGTGETTLSKRSVKGLIKFLYLVKTTERKVSSDPQDTEPVPLVS